MCKTHTEGIPENAADAWTNNVVRARIEISNGVFLFECKSMRMGDLFSRGLGHIYFIPKPGPENNLKQPTFFLRFSLRKQAFLGLFFLDNKVPFFLTRTK